MASTKITVFWIEDQLAEFIDGGWKVLKVELEKLGFKLEDEGPLEAKTVEKAELMLKEFNTQGEQKLDIILLDLMLPQDDDDVNKKRVDLDAGYLIWFEIRHLKKWPNLMDVPIIVITARGRPEYMDQMIADFPTRWLSKPADPTTVAKEIADLLHLVKGKQENVTKPQSTGNSISIKSN